MSKEKKKIVMQQPNNDVVTINGMAVSEQLKLLYYQYQVAEESIRQFSESLQVVATALQKGEKKLSTSQRKMLKTMGEHTKKIYKKKKVRDPARPKRPITAYQLYCNSKRPEVKAQYGSLKPTEMMRLLSKSWRECGTETRSQFQAIADQKKKAYEQEMVEYNKNRESFGNMKVQWSLDPEGQTKKKRRKSAAPVQIVVTESTQRLPNAATVLLPQHLL
eukprot:g5359.t1